MQLLWGNSIIKLLLAFFEKVYYLFLLEVQYFFLAMCILKGVAGRNLFVLYVK